jgi:uncharacterized protein YdcH (DUF465 family)
MFEFDQEIVQTLLSTDETFRRLYEKHRMLKQQVHEANIGALPMDDVSLENMKKQKLLLKDKMAQMIEKYRKQHA